MQATSKAYYAASGIDWVVGFSFLDGQSTTPLQAIINPLVDL
jgi:hypothetical protein